MEHESYLPRIEAILEEKQLTFKGLAQNLHMPEHELKDGLVNQTFNMRALKAMSKYLQVDMYSFFFPVDYPVSFPSKSLDSFLREMNDGEEVSPSKIMEEIGFLEHLLAYKKEQLAKWYPEQENQLVQHADPIK